MSENDYELNEVIHPTLLNPYLSKKNFQINCELITKYNIRNISTSLYFLKYLKDSINYKNCKINALISYPLADIPSKFLSEIINYAKEYGANGIEFLPRFFYLSDSKEEDFAREIEILIQSSLPITLIFNYQRWPQFRPQNYYNLARIVDKKHVHFRPFRNILGAGC